MVPLAGGAGLGNSGGANDLRMKAALAVTTWMVSAVAWAG